MKNYQIGLIVALVVLVLIYLMVTGRKEGFGSRRRKNMVKRRRFPRRGRVGKVRKERYEDEDEDYTEAFTDEDSSDDSDDSSSDEE